MPKKKTPSDRFAALTWDDLNRWAGNRIVGRGRSYQQQGRVSNLAMTDDGALIAWVDGSQRYATRVAMDEDGLPESICTCPYEINCKHGVAVVLEYLEQVENNLRVPKAKQDDARLLLLEDEDRHDEPGDDDAVLPEDVIKDVGAFLKGKSKVQLVELIHELAEEYPEMALDLADRRQIVSGNVKSMVTRLRREIREIGEESDWQNYRRCGDYTPDYSDIRTKLETLLKAGHDDEVLALGKELIEVGTDQVMVSHDDGETAMEIESCVPTLIKALERSSINTADKLAWAVDVVLRDEYDIYGAFFDYLHQKHPQAAWHSLADRLLERLSELKSAESIDDFSSNYARDRLSDWVIHALERAGRKDEIIPLCEAEAKKTGAYVRLVERLMAARRREEAEGWIQEGIRATEDTWPGTAANLRSKMREIRTRQKNWPAVAAMQAEEFVRDPSRDTFTDCKKAAGKIKAWPKVRGRLLAYLKSGTLPWEQKGWPLPESGLDRSETFRGRRFPMLNDLIDICILENKPDQVLHWYDRLPKNRFGWHSADEDAIATAVQVHAPDRAVAIWKNKAERLIGQVKPSAYREAAVYLRKAGKVMAREKKVTDWDRYLKELRAEHNRKRRLLEILDGLDGKPIVKKRW